MDQLGDRAAQFIGLGCPICSGGVIEKKGVAGIVASQVLPFADAQVLGLWVNFESGVYNGLS